MMPTCFLLLSFSNQIVQTLKDLILSYLQRTELFINVGLLVTMTQKKFKWQDKNKKSKNENPSQNS